MSHRIHLLELIMLAREGVGRGEILGELFSPANKNYPWKLEEENHNLKKHKFGKILAVLMVERQEYCNRFLESMGLRGEYKSVCNN